MYDFEVSQGDWIISGTIDTYHCQPPFRGSPHLCDSDLDYYGYTDFEYHITRLENEDTLEIIEGDYLDKPEDVSDSMLEDAILTQYKESQEP